MSAKKHPTRPWYCSDRLCEDWKTVERNGGDLRMLRALKIVRTIVANLAIAAVSLLSLLEGANPDLVMMVSLPVLAAYNGVEFADYQALAQAIVEVSQESSSDQNTDE